MKKKYIIIGAISLFIAYFLYSSLQTVQPEINLNSPDWVALNEASDLARQADKLILVDVFEVGCKYCRAMDREVYPDSTVRAVMDPAFVPVKLDGNSEELVSFNGVESTASEFAKSKGAYVFPTTLILDADGNVINSRTGFMSADELRDFLYRANS